MPDSIEKTHLAGARSGDQQYFDKLVEPYRTELQIHCYRMPGSLQDAEDSVQETLLRAWRHLDTYGGASFRAWLYKIATNACLDALSKDKRRVLPTVAFQPADPHEPFLPPTPDLLWLEPLPDTLLTDVAPNPEAQYNTSESVKLAFLVALQCLPPRQRAVLILRDVRDWRAKEAAEHLEMTVSAVNSALNRARVTLAKHYQADEPDVLSITHLLTRQPKTCLTSTCRPGRQPM